MSQLNAELEEAAYVSGVGKVRTLMRITFRLLSPAFIAGWIWVFAHAIRNLSVPLLLATADNQTIATTLYYYWNRKADFSLTAALASCSCSPSSSSRSLGAGSSPPDSRRECVMRISSAPEEGGDRGPHVKRGRQLGRMRQASPKQAERRPKREGSARWRGEQAWG